MNRWNVSTIGDISDVNYGYTAKASHETVGPRFLRITDIQNEQVDWNTVPSCAIAENDFKKHRLRTGDLVFARTGATTGKSYLINDPPEAVAASYLIRLRVKDPEVLPKYVARYFNTKAYWAIVNAGISGSAQGGFNASKLSAIRIPLPPLPEQKRIAAILDRADALRQNRTRARQLADTFLKSTFLKMFGDPVTNPKGWEIKPLGQLLSRGFQNGAYYPKEKYCNRSESAGVEMVHMADAFYGVVRTSNLQRVDVSEKDCKKYGLDEYDLLVARRSLNYEGAAKPCRVPSIDRSLIFESSLIRVTADRTILDPLYLFHFLANPQARKHHLFKYVTVSTISGINQGGLRRVQIVLPPIEQQIRFRNFALALEHTTALMHSHTEQFSVLFDSLVHRAFNGSLSEPMLSMQS